ncbi:MAG: PIN domain-containing protein [Gammaproteobacteria bacterium]
MRLVREAARMIAIDTNVLVRILIDDDGAVNQVKTARQFAKKHKKLFIPQLVQVELVWVLSSAYELDKSEIVTILQHLCENGAFILQRKKQFEDALHLYQTNNTGFSDCLIQVESIDAGYEVATFDKKFAKLSEVKLLMAE